MTTTDKKDTVVKMAQDGEELPIDLFEGADEATVAAERPWEVSPCQLPNGKTLELQPASAKVWGSALNLSCWLCEHPSMVLGKQILELGCAAGLPSLVSAALGAKSVIGTDVDPFGVAALERAIARNGMTNVARAATLDWRSASQRASFRAVPVLLAADCNYESKAVTPLLATIDALLAPGGVLLIASRLARYGLADCLRRLGSTTAEGGLALRLDGVVSFDSDAHAIERREGGSAVAAAEVAEAEAAEAAARAGDASEDNAPHRLWIFTRSNATAAGEAGVADSKAVAVQTQPDLEAAAASCYHERQRLMRCGRHALNNLIGSAAFDTRTLDKFALQISGDGLGQAIAHRWPVLGNYDCNVILLALQQCGLAAEWWDKRRPESELHAALNLTESERACEEQQQPAAERGLEGELVGVLLNVRSRPKMFGGLVPLGRHWLALRPLAHTDRRWVDVDSHLERPRLLTDEAELLTKLGQHLGEDDGHLIIVRRSS